MSDDGNNGSDDSTCVYLTLGDGDFSYSLDLARYLAQDQDSRESPTRKRYKIIATGLDSLDELTEKYRDTPSILKQLLSLGDSSERISVEIHHEINAVSTEAHPSSITTLPNQQAHHVMFHHPHLGTEDAARHARFLSHLLHAAAHRWMKRHGGVLYLTLVKGQYERWQCDDAARRHGLVLISRHVFVPPPVAASRRCYEARRHQTGKSFATRATGGSETFTFGRLSEVGEHVATSVPWQPTKTRVQTDKYHCQQCDRAFREERSLKSHVQAVHSTASGGKKRKRHKVIECASCKKQNIIRTFAHEQALEDHVRAKHVGTHSIIRPYWALKKESKSGINGETMPEPRQAMNHTNSRDSCKSCSICSLVFLGRHHENMHVREFVPAPVVGSCAEETVSFRCSRCAKKFRDLRAQQQHENFCTVPTAHHTDIMSTHSSHKE